MPKPYASSDPFSTAYLRSGGSQRVSRFNAFVENEPAEVANGLFEGGLLEALARPVEQKATLEEILRPDKSQR